MEKARVLSVVVLAVFSVLLMSNLVAAADPPAKRSIATDINKAVEGFTGIFKPIFEQILGKDEKATDAINNKYLFARVLLLILIFSILFSVLGTITFFKEKPWVLVVMSVVISILAMRGIVSQALLETILLPTEALGVALTAGIPFVVYFMIVEFNGQNWPRPARNTAWIFFGVIFLGLWVARYDEIAAVADPWAAYIYPFTALLAFLMMVFDGTIQKWRAQIYASKVGSESAKREIAELIRKIDQAHKDAAGGYGTGKVYTNRAEYRADVDDMRKRIADLKAQL